VPDTSADFSWVSNTLCATKYLLLSASTSSMPYNKDLDYQSRQRPTFACGCWGCIVLSAGASCCAWLNPLDSDYYHGWDVCTRDLPYLGSERSGAIIDKTASATEEELRICTVVSTKCTWNEVFSKLMFQRSE
jgi:hypothetical protein